MERKITIHEKINRIEKIVKELGERILENWVDVLSTAKAIRQIFELNIDPAEKFRQAMVIVTTKRPHPEVLVVSSLSSKEVQYYLNSLKYIRAQLTISLNEVRKSDDVELIAKTVELKYLVEILLDALSWYYRDLFMVPKELIEAIGDEFPKDSYEILDDEVFKRVSIHYGETIYARGEQGVIVENIKLVRDPGKRFFKIVVTETLPDGRVITAESPKEINLGVLHGYWISALRTETIDFKVFQHKNPEPYYKAYTLRIRSYEKGNPRQKFSTIKNKFLVDIFITKGGQVIFTKGRDYTLGVMDPAVKGPYGARAGENVVLYTKSHNVRVTIDEFQEFLGESEVAEASEILEIFKVPLGKTEGYLVLFSKDISKIHIVGAHPVIEIELPPSRAVLFKKQGGYIVIE